LARLSSKLLEPPGVPLPEYGNATIPHDLFLKGLSWHYVFLSCDFCGKFSLPNVQTIGAIESSEGCRDDFPLAGSL
jgi:hypothetical protein